MARAQAAIEQSGDLMNKFQRIDYCLHCVLLVYAIWIPFVRDYGIWPDFTTTWERGVKPRIPTLEDYPGILTNITKNNQLFGLSIYFMELDT